MKKNNIKKIIPFLFILFCGVMLLGCFLMKDAKDRTERIQFEVGSVEENHDVSKSEKENIEEIVDEEADTETIEKETDIVPTEKSENVENEMNVNADAENALQSKKEDNVQESVVTTEENKKTDNEKDAEIKYIKFPYEISQSNLVIQWVQAYSGSYVEDGTNDQVSDITAILVTNVGKECVEFADITLTTDRERLKFSLSALEAGASCVLLEMNRVTYEKQEYLECTAETAFLDEMEMAENVAEVTELKSGALAVKNVSSTTLPCVRLFYKYYDSEEKIYIGGIAYTSQITDLESGYSKMVTPAHYQPGQSKVIMVRTYDSYE